MSKPKTQPEPNPEAITEMLASPTPFLRPLQVKIVGIGGAGIHTIAHLSSQELADVEVIAVDTDAQTLLKFAGAKKIQIGESQTHGLSAGGDPDLGRSAAESEIAKLQELLVNAELVVLVVGLGGGTGSGAAPLIAQLAQQMGALTLGVVLLPFEFEAQTRRSTATMAAVELRKICDAILPVAQNMLFADAGNHASAETTFRSAESLAVQAIHCLVTLLTAPGMGEVSLDDLRKAWGSTQSELSLGFSQTIPEPIVTSDKKCILSLLRQAFKTPTCAMDTLATSKHIFVHVQGFDLRLAETMLLIEELKKMNPNARVSLCASLDPKKGDVYRVAVFAARPNTSVLVVPDGSTQNNRLESAFSGTAFGSARLVSQPRQQILNLETLSRGRFEKSEPTIYEGEDLDIPTFLRKNVRLS